MTTIGHKEKLLLTIEIQDNLVSQSTSLDDQTKQAVTTFSKYIKAFLIDNPKANSYQLKSLTNDLLTYWNESIKPDIELFWTELRNNKIDFERKEPLRFALTKNRFRRVEQGIDARNYWESLKTQNSIIDNFNIKEIQQIDNVIFCDEKNRHDILKKCLNNKAIVLTSYLKFGECMAYFANCQLFDKYFTIQEVEELYDIWKKYK